MIRTTRLPFVLALLAVPGQSFAEGIAIEHKPVACIVAGKYPKLPACFTPANKLARSRVYFRAETGGANWYYVEMKSDAPCFAGILPKPKKDLIGKKVFYYLNAFDKDSTDTRTPDITAEVVKSEGECKKDVPVAPFVNNASVAVFPSLPAGFAGAGLSTAAVVGIAAGGAAVVGGGIAVASSSGSDDTTTTTTQSPGIPAQTTTTTTTTTTSTTLAVSQTPFRPDFRINPNPATGVEPLRVEFNMCASSGVNLRYTYDFNGDGVEDFRGPCRVVRTFTTSAITASAVGPLGTLPVVTTYNSIMRVFEVSETALPPTNDASQANPITVKEAAAVATFPGNLAAKPSSRAGSSSTIAPTRRVAFSSQLDVAGASGQVVVNGSTAVFAGTGRSAAMAVGRRGENRIEAQLVQGGAAGLWRFELGSTASLEPGSLRVVAGNVALVTGDAVVFRLTGRPGERVVFTFRAGN